MSRGVLAHRHHRWRGDRGADCGPGDCAPRIRRHRIRPGATPRRDRRRHSTVAQRIAHFDCARPRRAIAAACGRSRGAAGHERADGARACVRAPRRDCGEALRRALLGHPSRRLASRAHRRGARPSRYRSQSRRQGRGFRAQGGRRHSLRALRTASGRRSRRRADCRRRVVVERAPEPRFARRTAWRALAPADALMPELREPAVNLWFGTRAHLVHYPVRGGSLINVVAIVRDDWREPGWSAPGERAEILARYRAPMWSALPRAILAAPEHWQKWALYDRAPLAQWGKGPATLLGDAAHPMLPYLAQGAAMAIEDAAVIAQRLADARDDPAGAMRRYERQRRARTARAQRAARRNGMVYQLGGAGAFLRTLALTAISGERLLARYDWLYGWAPG